MTPKDMSKKPQIALYTLGCRANQFDSESVMAQFKQQGYERTSEFSSADVHVVNTCTVTNPGDAKSRQVIKKILKMNSGKVIVTGCSAQQDAKALAELGVDLVVDNANKDELYQHFLNHSHTPVVTSSIRHLDKIKNTPIENFGEKARAHLKIQDGCNQYCSYCIIPFVRGRSRSLPPHSVLEQLQKLIQNGYQEIVLTGIHVGYYNSEDLSLSQILSQILEMPGNFRIRISSIEPLEIDEAMLALFRKYPKKLCRHLHIAIQSGSDAILSEMKRRYDKAYLKKLFSSLYQLDPLFGIGLDVIVGFPGETEEQFQETLTFIKNNPVSYGHVFRFSPKKGTPAAKSPHSVSGKIKKERSEVLRQLIAQQQSQFLNKMAESTQEVIPETATSGCTANYTHVRLNNISPDAIGKILTVKLKKQITQNKNDKFPSIEATII